MLRVQPRLRTARLRLRPFVAEDAEPFAELAGAREVADTLPTLAHPFSLSNAKSTIAAYAARFHAGTSVHFAVEAKEGAPLIGGVEIDRIDRDHARAELRFWIGLAHQRQGHASEAAAAVLHYALGDLGLHRLEARHLVRDGASAVVLQRIGMRPEGVLRAGLRRWGVFEDVALYAAIEPDLRAAAEPLPQRPGCS